MFNAQNLNFWGMITFLTVKICVTDGQFVSTKRRNE